MEYPRTPTAATLAKYGITALDYDRIWKLQGGLCGVCGKPEKKRPLVVDHNHETGRVRGLVHAPCNYALGLYEAGLFASYIRYGAVNNALFQHGRRYAMGAA